MIWLDPSLKKFDSTMEDGLEKESLKVDKQLSPQLEWKVKKA